MSHKEWPSCEEDRIAISMFVEKLRKPCGRSTGHGESCVRGYLCDSCEVKAMAAAEIERLMRVISDGTFSLQARTAETLDAERYRFLRDGASFEGDGPSVVSGLGDAFDYHWGTEVDEVVDAAMARWKAAGSPK